jgi:hypothetical protein
MTTQAEALKIAHDTLAYILEFPIADKARMAGQKAIAALATVNDASPSPVSVQPSDEQSYLHWCQTLITALKRLSLAAQTTGGTAGPDAELQAAIAEAERAMSLGACSAAIDKAEAAQAAPSVPEEWKLTEKANCYQLAHGNEVVALLSGPNAEANAAKIASMLAAAPSPDPLQELADQAQALDMGYGPNACPTCGKSVPSVSADAMVLDWLEEQIVELIYLDDGRFIDVKGNSVREAIRAAIAAQSKDSGPNDAKE